MKMSGCVISCLLQLCSVEKAGLCCIYGKCWAAKDASGARLHSLATFEGVFDLGQSCRAKCDVIGQKTRPLNSAAHTALVADAASGDGEPNVKTS